MNSNDIQVSVDDDDISPSSTSTTSTTSISTTDRQSLLTSRGGANGEYAPMNGKNKGFYDKNKVFVLGGVGFVIFLFLLTGIVLLIRPPAPEGGFEDKTTKKPGPVVLDKPTVIILSFDGFRFKYLADHATPNIDSLIQTGALSSMRPIFPSKTFPNHYTIVTGLYAESHGIVANHMYDPLFNAYFSLSNHAEVTNGRWWGGEPIWVTAERHNQTAGTYFWPGSEAPIEGVRPTYYYRYDESVPYTQRIDQILKWLELEGSARPTVMCGYFDKVDTMGHRYGPDASQTAAAIKEMDDLVGRLITGLKDRSALDQVDIILVADHGMTATSQSRVILLDDYLNATITEVIDWNPVAAIRVPEPTNVNQVFDSVKNAHPNMKCYKKDQVPSNYHFQHNRRIMDVICVADLGWSITSRAYFNNNPSQFNGGTHGYNNTEPDMQALFVASGPHIQQKTNTKDISNARVLENINVYPIMTQILNLPAAPNNGSYSVVNQYVRQPNP